MKIWYAIRRETAAAWRSLRYDLRRHGGGAGPSDSGPPDDGELTTDLSRAKVVVEPYLDRAPRRGGLDRRPTRLRPVASVAVLAVALAGITYLGVLQGLSALADRTSPVSSLPVVEGEGRIGPAPTAPTSPPTLPVPPVPVQPAQPPQPTATASAPPGSAPPTPAPPTESTRAPSPTASSPSPTPTPSRSATASPAPDPTGSPTTRTPDPSQPATPGRASAS